MASIILSKLLPSKAGEIIAGMDDEIAETSALHMAGASAADQPTLSAITEVLEIEYFTSASGEESPGNAAFYVRCNGRAPQISPR